uniref:Uncharacterized protein n=1 Tax=Arundo donax TaxID=35708 RepID=A0A0A8Z1Z0_ARUDO
MMDRTAEKGHTTSLNLYAAIGVEYWTQWGRGVPRCSFRLARSEKVLVITMVLL